jgi:hypothetical protein
MQLDSLYTLHTLQLLAARSLLIILQWQSLQTTDKQARFAVGHVSRRSCKQALKHLYLPQHASKSQLQM